MTRGVGAPAGHRRDHGKRIAPPPSKGIATLDVDANECQLHVSRLRLRGHDACALVDFDKRPCLLPRGCRANAGSTSQRLAGGLRGAQGDRSNACNAGSMGSHGHPPARQVSTLGVKREGSSRLAAVTVMRFGIAANVRKTGAPHVAQKRCVLVRPLSHVICHCAVSPVIDIALRTGNVIQEAWPVPARRWQSRH